MYRIRVILKVLYIKWIKGECRHLCALCQYPDECWENFDYDSEVKM